MAGLLEDERGGILGLLDLPWETWEAITADLLDRGFTIDDVPHRVDWLHIFAMVRHAREGSAFHQQRRRDADELPRSADAAQHVGKHADWPEDRHISMMLLDQLRIANWYTAAKNQAQSGKGTPPLFPEPMWRPGVEPDEVVNDGFIRRGNTTVVGTPMPMRDFNRWWNATQEERDNWKEGK